MSGKQGDEGVMIHIHPMAKLLRGGGAGSRRNAGKFSVVRNERRKSFRVVLEAVGEEIPPINLRTRPVNPV